MRNARGRSSRRRLLDAGLAAAADLSAVEALAGVRAGEVAGRAGLTTGAFYHAFGDHAGFVQALVEHGLAVEGGADSDEIDRTTEALTAYAEAPGHRLVTDLKAIADLNFEMVSRAPQLRTFEQLMWACRRDPVAGSHLRALYTGFTDLYLAGYEVILGRWQRSVRPPLTSYDLAVILSALADGLTIRHGIQPEAVPPELFGHAVLALLPGLTRAEGDRHDVYEHLEAQRVPDWRRRTVVTRRHGSRRSVVAATLELLEDVTFDDLTIERIAERAGVHPSTVYDNFGSKRGVARAALADVVAPWAGRPEAELAEGSPPVEVLKRQVHRLAATALEHRELLTGVFDTFERPTADGESPANPLPPLFLGAVEAAQSDGSLRSDLPAFDVAVVIAGLVARGAFVHPEVGAEGLTTFLSLVCLEGLLPRVAPGPGSDPAPGPRPPSS